MFLTLERLLSRVPPWLSLVAAAVWTLAIALLDLWTGFEVSLSVLYLGPIALAGWACGTWAGVGISMLSSLAWLSADLWAGHAYSHPAIPEWNALVRLGLFLVTAALLGSLRKQLFLARTGARVDALTGIANRAAFLERLEHDLAIARRQGSPLTLGYLDLDDFKLVNDRKGHVEGDRVLRAFASLLKASLRDADTVARLGGDEFAILLPDTNADGAREVVGRLRATLASDGPPLESSLGVVTFLATPRGVEDALRAADDVLYAVKRDGKNAVQFETIDLPEVELRPMPAQRKAPPSRAGSSLS